MALEVTEWVDHNGVVVEFPYVSERRNFYLTGRRVTTVETPGLHGSTVESADWLSRTVGIAFNHVGPVDTWREECRSFANRLAAGDGAGTLRNTRNGLIRELTPCYYLDGYGLDENSPTHVRPAVTLLAPDPYWRSPETSHTFDLSGTGGTFFPIFPLELTSSEALTSEQVEVSGDEDVPAPPTWTLVGPVTNPVIRHDGTGQVLDFTAGGGLTLASGEILTITTTRGNKGAVSNVAGDVAGYLTPASEFFHLRSGQANRIEFEGAATDGTTDLTVVFRPGWRTA